MGKQITITKKYYQKRRQASWINQKKSDDTCDNFISNLRLNNNYNFSSNFLNFSFLKPRDNRRNIVGCYMLRPFAHPVACCCVLLLKHCWAKMFMLCPVARKHWRKSDSSAKCAATTGTPHVRSPSSRAPLLPPRSFLAGYLHF